MERIARLSTSVGLLPAVYLLTSCAALPDVSSFRASKEDPTGLHHVDSLVEEVERVHLQAEVARAGAREAAVELEALVAYQRGVDPMVAYAAFVEAVERSRADAAALAARADPLQAVAEAHYARWDQDLQDFSLPSLRQRSRVRLDASRARLEVLLETVDHARRAHEAFNLGLGDVAAFLEHDFNPTAVRDLEVETRAILDYSAELDRRMGRVLAAAEDFVSASALHGTVEVVQPVDVAQARY